MDGGIQIFAQAASVPEWTGITGSVVFAGVEGKLSENNPKLFWDNNNFRFGVGINNPTEALHVIGNIKATGDLKLEGIRIYGDNKEMFRFNDAWLRINGANQFSSGIYCGTSKVRTDGHMQVGSGNNVATLNRNRLSLGSSATNSYGYIEFRNSANTRGGYIGYGNGSDTLHMQLDAAQRWRINKDLWVKGKYQDSSGDAGTSGQVLTSTSTGTNWTDPNLLSNTPVRANVHLYSGGNHTYYWIRIGQAPVGARMSWDLDTYGDNNYPKHVKFNVSVHNYSSNISISVHKIYGFSTLEILEVKVTDDFNVWVKIELSWSHGLYVTNTVNYLGVPNYDFTGVNKTATDPTGKFPITKNDFAARYDATSGAMTHSYSDRKYYVNGVLKGVLLGNGNRGLGTSAPNEKLHVIGNIRTTGNIFLNGGVYVDGKKSISSTGASHTATFTDNSHYGYYEFTRGDGTRGGYIGYGNGGDFINLTLDAASRFYINKTLHVGDMMYAKRVSCQSTGYISLWNQSSTYTIDMRNDSNHHYGGVTSYAIKNNMSANSNRGWVWGIYNQVPIMSVTTQGHMKLAGDIHAVKKIKDTSGSGGTSGQVLTSTGTGTQWSDAGEGFKVLTFIGMGSTAAQTGNTWTSPNIGNRIAIPSHLDGYKLKRAMYTVTTGGNAELGLALYQKIPNTTTEGLFSVLVSPSDFTKESALSGNVVRAGDILYYQYRSQNTFLVNPVWVTITLTFEL